MKFAGAVTPGPANVRQRRWVRGLLEAVLILGLYVLYTVTRTVADTSLAPAVKRAEELLHVENVLGIQWEVPLNQLFSDHRVLGLAGSYWYASLHYIVTMVVLVWLWRLGSDRYGPARRALAIGTFLGLVAYISLPTAPPRFMAGYVDVLSLHSADGWWGADASAPRGLGGLTNELAAFPSLHAEWSLWVALALQIYATRRWIRVLGWLYALGTSVVIIGTGNHWVIDAVVGWLVIMAGWTTAEAMGRIPLSRVLRRVLRRGRAREEIPEEPSPDADRGDDDLHGVLV